MHNLWERLYEVILRQIPLIAHHCKGHKIHPAILMVEITGSRGRESMRFRRWQLVLDTGNIIISSVRICHVILVATTGTTNMVHVLASSHCNSFKDWGHRYHLQEPGLWFNIKMSSSQYRKSHCGDKTVVRSSYLHNWISHIGKMSCLYWIGALIFKCVAEISLHDMVPE